MDVETTLVQGSVPGKQFQNSTSQAGRNDTRCRWSQCGWTPESVKKARKLGRHISNLIDATKQQIRAGRRVKGRGLAWLSPLNSQTPSNCKLRYSVPTQLLDDFEPFNERTAEPSAEF